MIRKEKSRNRNGKSQNKSSHRYFICPCDWLHRLCGRFWNREASMEIDRLTVEVERLQELLEARHERY